MSMLSEFREFAVKGNMVDMAVGIIIGGAFGKIVSSLVGDVLMPPLGLVIGGVDFSKLGLTLKPGPDADHPLVVLGYGKFLQTGIDFLIVAFAMFMVVKAINSLKREKPAAPAAPPPPTKDQVLLTEIRDLLAKRG
ncbi:MAG TPA: large-conductance mechanosensitive channel protein MscL [Candidatus Margulisiibacteriota bacterium]|nr:large-conductance mechanosensitive channel protein MscL [Candidatus Margulisiibacteriota bacterium]